MKVLFALCALLFSSLALAKPLDNIIVFGDSLSDNGNLFEYMEKKIPQSPPYFEGRFSNGPVWVEHLAYSYFHKNAKARLVDYAFGGAGISVNNTTNNDEILFSLKRELDTYLNAHQGKADENSLFIVWIGANNYLAIPEDVETTLKDVGTGLAHGLQRLVNAGAKHVLVVNLPDLGRTPIAKEFESSEAETLSYFSRRHNEHLLNTINELQQANPQVQWIHFDVYSKLNDVLQFPENYGFKNITDTCYSSYISKRTQNSALDLAAGIKLKAKVDRCEGYLFFDPLHPTTPAHQVLATHAKAILDAEGIVFEER